LSYICNIENIFLNRNYLYNLYLKGLKENNIFRLFQSVLVVGSVFVV
jgi:hypothetical protein